jgi:hypothetical protein
MLWHDLLYWACADRVLVYMNIHKTCDIYNVNYIKFWQWTKYCWQRLTGDRPDLSSERAPHRDNTANFRQKISGHKSQSELDTKTDWPSVVTWLWLWLFGRELQNSGSSSKCTKSSRTVVNLLINSYEVILSVVWARSRWSSINANVWHKS